MVNPAELALAGEVDPNKCAILFTHQISELPHSSLKAGRLTSPHAHPNKAPPS